MEQKQSLKIVLSVAAWLSLTVPSAWAQGYVKFYEHTGYVGASLSEVNNSPSNPSWNDRISSLQVPNGWQVTLYEHTDFMGASTTITADVPSLLTIAGPCGGNWNDCASSFKIVSPTSTIAYATLANSDGTLDTVNSSNPYGPISSVRIVQGRYTITFSGISGGNAVLVSALGGTAEYCKLFDSSAVGVSPFLALVHCYTPAGIETDSRFSVTVLGPSNEQQIVYSTVLGDIYHSYTWNPAGLTTITSSATGVYVVTFQGLFGSPNHAQVTARSLSNNSCQTTNWNAGGAVVVQCSTPAGVASNEAFEVAFVTGTSTPRLGYASGDQIGITKSYNSAGGTPTFINNAPGKYTVRFPGLNPNPKVAGAVGVAQVSGASTAFTRCTVISTAKDGPDLVASIGCFNAAGTFGNGGWALMVLPPEQGPPPVLTTWYLNQVRFDDGGTASGSFVFDSSLGRPVSVAINTTTGAKRSGAGYTNVHPSSPGNTSRLNTISGSVVPPYTGRAAFTLDTVSVLTNASGNIPVKQGGGTAPESREVTCNDSDCIQVTGPFRYLAGGWVSTTNCSYDVTPSTVDFFAGGGNVSLNVTTSAGCPWAVSGVVAPVTITQGGGGGTGNGSVGISVAANTTPSSRSVQFIVAGKTITINQAGVVVVPPCTFTLSQTSITVPAAGGSANITLNNTAGANCNWSVNNPALNWIALSQSTGTGTSQISLTVQPNPSTGDRQITLTIAGLLLTVIQPGTGQQTVTGLRFVPLTPCRLVDTRPVYAPPRTGAFGPPRLNAATTRTIPIPASTTCTIPATAKAYVFNVTLDTIEGQTGPVDFVTIYPTGEARPDFWTARTTTGGYIANAAIVKAGTNGSIDVYTSNNVNFILDINGYFTDDGNTPGLLYYPIQPCRAVDTRGPVYSSLPAPYGNLRLGVVETRTLRLPGSPACQIPVAAAYSTQLTLAPGELTNGSPVAFLTAWPTGVSQPNISNMNAYFGYAVANSGIIPASSNGSINVFALDATNLIIDVNGYFAPDDHTGRGLRYYPTRQCRVMNTQDGSKTGPFGGPAMTAGVDRTIPIPAGGCAGLPTTAKAWAANATVVPNGTGMPYLSMWPAGTPWPNISQLNAFQGQTVSNSGIVPAAADGSISVRVAAATQVAVDIAGYFAP